MDKFDVVVIGAGPGGYVAAIRCAQLGLKTACIEQWIDDTQQPLLGGTCLNVGCIPSKALLQSSDYYDKSRHHFSQHGINIDHVELDLATMMQRKQSIVTKMGMGIVELFKAHGVTLFSGRGKLLREHQVEIKLNDGNETRIQGEHIILAPGSRPKAHPQLPFQPGRIIDSSEALSLNEVPESMAVIGAGVIALELGSVWQRLGSQVSLFKSRPGLLPQLDPAIARQAQNAFNKQGLKFCFGTRIESCEVKKDHVLLTYNDGEKTQQEKFDTVLVAIGREANTANLAAEDCGLQMADGNIIVDEKCRTNLDRIYAIGDAVRGPMLAHKSSEEGVMVAEQIAGHATAINYQHIPYIIYTNPEIAWCGETETRLKEDGIEFKAGVFPFSANGRAHAGGEAAGLIKVIADKHTDRILGVHMIGPHVSELIQQAVIALEFKASSEDLALSMFAHPTLSESLHEAVLDVDDRSIHKLKLG